MKNELIADLGAKLEELFRPNSYSLQITGDGLTLSSCAEDITRGFEIAVIRRDKLYIDPGVALRFGIVETIYSEITGRSVPRENCWTLGTSLTQVNEQPLLARLLGVHYAPYQLMPLNAKGDVERIAAKLRRGFLRIACPFYSRFSNLHQLERHLNQPGVKLVRYVGTWFEHALKGLIVAHCINRQDISDLIERYQKTNCR